jgi:hypothetical protein
VLGLVEEAAALGVLHRPDRASHPSRHVAGWARPTRSSATTCAKDSWSSRSSPHLRSGRTLCTLYLCRRNQVISRSVGYLGHRQTLIG